MKSIFTILILITVIGSVFTFIFNYPCILEGKLVQYSYMYGRTC